MIRVCTVCEREFSKLEEHAVCKRCRPSNGAYEQSYKGKARKQRYIERTKFDKNPRLWLYQTLGIGQIPWKKNS